MREIVTIQVGDFANYIGSHFWNFQDELLGLADEPDSDPVFRRPSLDMDILYRTGETRQGICTYCPRLISIGSQGSLGSLSSSGSLNSNTSSVDAMDVVTWTGKVTRSVGKPCDKNKFLQSLSEEEQDKSSFLVNDTDREGGTQRRIQDKDRVESLENDVRFWTDYSKVQYHPQTLYELYGSWTDFNKFDNYGTGKDVSEWSHIEEMNERLRFFVEECDHIQGIQFIVDDSGGFSSIAADFLQNIADEYTNSPVLLYSARDPVTYACAINQRESITRSLHDAVSFSKLSCFCKLMIPVGLPSLSKMSSLLSVKDEKLFHCSAVYAASIHSVSVPFRLKPLGPNTESAYATGALDIGELIHILAGQGRQNMVSIMDIAMPTPSLTDEIHQGHIQRSLHSLTPEIGEDDEDLYAIESLMVHGAFHSGDQRASVAQVKNSVCAAYEGRCTKPMFSHLSATLCPLPIPLPFPTIFDSSVGSHGEILGNQSEKGQPRGSLEIDSVPVATRLRSSRAIMPFIDTRLTNLRKHGIARGARGAELLRGWGFGKEELEDMEQDLSKMLSAFDPYSQLTSDSD
ncbi:uncharacterized protein [Typha latifolia]|uniref:uncharacterized protein isoform X1 n=2 Tax=Typha latifolia TaxID=4733 RepID=UPI003C2B012D